MNKTQMSEPSVEEAISRQAAIDAIENHRFAVKDVEQEDDVKWGLAMALEVIERLPSVTPAEKVGRWIPISEGLPEEHKEVLTCSLGGFIEIQSIEHDYWENQNGDWTDIDDNEVAAWMPLPEPYKASPTGAEGSEKDEDDR